MEHHYRQEGADLLLRVRISPRASRDKVGDVLGDRIKISITAPPVDGKANAHLTRLLAKEFGVTRSQVTVEHGHTSRDKTIRITAPARIPDCFGISDKGS